MTKYFMGIYPFKVTGEEIKKFYDKLEKEDMSFAKNIPQLILLNEKDIYNYDYLKELEYSDDEYNNFILDKEYIIFCESFYETGIDMHFNDMKLTDWVNFGDGNFNLDFLKKLEFYPKDNKPILIEYKSKGQLKSIAYVNDYDSLIKFCEEGLSIYEPITHIPLLISFNYSSYWTDCGMEHDANIELLGYYDTNKNYIEI